jgi:hypothetical protein
VIGVATTYSVSDLNEADAVVRNLSQIAVNLREGKMQIRI